VTIALVHGNPETAEIWHGVVPRLSAAGHDVVCLSPPGFGSPVPDGFGATRLEYASWLVGELGAIGHPVHLVGHDWGGGHVLAVAMTRPDLLASWCVDVIGLVHPDYVWHDMAQIWQTAGAGEEMLTGWQAAPIEARAALFEANGMPPHDARSIATALDETMADCILRLYRSAAQPAMVIAGEELSAARARPGLAIVASDDTYVGTPEMALEMAALAGAHVAPLEGVGHWWMAQDPSRAAALLAWWVAENTSRGLSG
jgi:pimeloyl-ACP methyl ester carboxylesterase